MKTIAVVSCGLLLMFSAIQAEAVATLHIGPGAGNPCATGCGGDPNPISGETGVVFNVYQNAGGPPSLSITSLYLIFALPSGTLSNLTFDFTSYDPYPGTAVNGPDGNYSVALNGTLLPGEEVYSALGLTPPFNNSNNYGNYAAAVGALGVAIPAEFGLYAYLVPVLGGPNSLLNVEITSGSLPVGTIITAFAPGRPNYDTPFTEAGIYVPEPSTLLLLGAGLLGLGGFAWRRNRKV